MTVSLKKYVPHEAQEAFHYAADYLKRFVAMISGIRAGKTHAGSRQATKDAWNSKAPEDAVYGIIAPTFNMLDRTTWREFVRAARPFIHSENLSKKIIQLKNGREVFGFSAEDPDRIRNVTMCGFWVDEARECKNFNSLWEVLLGRVMSTGGKGIVTTSPNGYDDIYEVFVENKDDDYGVIKFSTYDNIYIPKTAIEQVERKYDIKFARQEIHGEFVIFEGQVYYTFNRLENAGDYAFKVCQYDPKKPIGLCCDFNVDPMAWVIVQTGKNAKTGLEEVYVIDEIFIRNTDTPLMCREFRTRYPRHDGGLILFGDATGRARHSSSNITNWKIIQDELGIYRVTNRVPNSNPAERDRVNAVNAMICNSRNERRVFLHPTKCRQLMKDFEKVPFKDGSAQIEKNGDPLLTHASDAFGYFIEKEFGLNKGVIEGLKI
jgi:hypothetical protein